MTKLESAIQLAQKGFHVFPIKTGCKQPPLIKDFPNRASRSIGQIADWWAKWPNANIGISTSKFGDNEALLVVDVDVKGDKNGEQELLRLELEGWEMPDTYNQCTPTSGRHLVYKVSTSVWQGVDVLGSGLDIRSQGGYILGSGSKMAAGEYIGDGKEVISAPEWLVDRCGRSPDNLSDKRRDRKSVVSIDEDRARERVIKYLKTESPLAIEGEGGDEMTYKVAARCMDLGADVKITSDLMLEYWNPRCSPPWSVLDLDMKISNASLYRNNPFAIDTPDVQFQKPFTEPEQPEKVNTEHPFDKINKEHAFVLAGGGAHILWETTDGLGRYRLEHLTISAFDAKFAPQKMIVGKKQHSVSKLWMEWKERREYDGLVFMPEQKPPSRFYNLWRGFSVKPAERMEENVAVNSFLEHAKNNVCRNENKLFQWLIGYFAHIIQRPWEKPLVALVFRGAKGVGKNALIETVGALLGSHFLLTSNRRYLVGNFNGHLENCLMFALDEAFWSGDKQAEGTLKDLITGKEHVIEHKGKEPYVVENKTRIIIIGNEDWLIPASYDERRFAVFDVGGGRKQDIRFFKSMRNGMDRGGYGVLLRFLLDYDISALDFNIAPSTQALMEQKQHTMEPLHQWWLDCLENGTLLCSEFPGWPEEVECERFRSAFRRYVKERQIRSRLPEDRVIGKLLKRCVPGLVKKRLNRREDGQPYAYTIPDLEIARKEWDIFIGHPTEWPNEGDVL